MIPTVVANAARKQTGSFLFDAEEELDAEFWVRKLGLLVRMNGSSFTYFYCTWLVYWGDNQIGGVICLESLLQVWCWWWTNQLQSEKAPKVPKVSGKGMERGLMIGMIACKRMEPEIKVPTGPSVKFLWCKGLNLFFWWFLTDCTMVSHH